MTFAALCMMAESKGWVVVIAANHAGSDVGRKDETAYMRTLAIYEDKGQWLAHTNPLVSVRLDDPPLHLNDASTSIATALVAAGVV